MKLQPDKDINAINQFIFYGILRDITHKCARIHSQQSKQLTDCLRNARTVSPGVHKIALCLMFAWNFKHHLSIHPYVHNSWSKPF